MLKKIIKNFSKLLVVSTLISVICVFIIALYFICYAYKTGLCTEYNNISDYYKALNDVRAEDGIVQFPKEIPQNAKEIVFFYFSGGFYHQRMFLEFKIDDKYITNELNNYKFLKAISAKDAEIWNNFYNVEQAKSEANIDTQKYDYYAIDNKRNKNLYEHKIFPYYCGIGVDQNNKKIFYYYINPEG